MSTKTLRNLCDKKNILDLDKIHASTSMTYIYDLPEHNYSTYHSKGTGFFIKYKHHKFLLTARHNCVNQNGDVDLKALEKLFIIQDPSKFYTEEFVSDFTNSPIMSFSLINLHIKNDTENDDFLIFRITSNPPADQYCFDIESTFYDYSLLSTHYIIGFPREGYGLTETETHRIHIVSPQVVELQNTGILMSKYRALKSFLTKQDAITDFSGFSGSPIVSCNNENGLVLEALCIYAKTDENHITMLKGIPIEIIQKAIDGFIDRLPN